jgi:hypothetical protein
MTLPQYISVIIARPEVGIAGTILGIDMRRTVAVAFLRSVKIRERKPLLQLWNIFVGELGTAFLRASWEAWNVVPGSHR